MSEFVVFLLAFLVAETLIWVVKHYILRPLGFDRTGDIELRITRLEDRWARMVDTIERLDSQIQRTRDDIYPRIEAVIAAVDLGKK